MEMPSGWKQPSDGYVLGKEGVLWRNEKTKGIFKNNVVEVQIITNYRVIKNDFGIMLKDIDDITVMNQHRISQSSSNYFGTYGGRYARFGTGNTTSRSKTIGDIVFMIGGKPVIIFRQIVDPHGVARLAKSARKQIIQTIKAIEKENFKRQREIEKAAKQKIVRKLDISHGQNNNYNYNPQIQNTKYFRNSITDKDEIEEIYKIKEMLNSNEKVLFVTKQSKIKPGGSYFSPNTIYATNIKIIIRDPYMLGIKTNVFDIPYDIITNLNLDKG